nr:DUF3784 domain-containing protein [uncultured Ruminococcus sp.]
MAVIKIIAVILGAAFLIFGYFIFFKERYDLINGFEADRRAGRRDEHYAKRVGLIELIVGAVMLIAGVVLIIFT